MKEKFKIRNGILILISISIIVIKGLTPEADAEAEMISSLNQASATGEIRQQLRVELPSRKSVVRNDIVSLTSKLPTRHREVVSHAVLTCSEVKTATATTTAKQDGFFAWTLMTVTAYNVGDPEQCDNTPCTAANGLEICQALRRGGRYVAANFANFGSIVKIKTKEGVDLGKFKVVDRTNERYKYRVDIAFPADEKAQALEFGKQTLFVRVIYEPNKDIFANAK